MMARALSAILFRNRTATGLFQHAQRIVHITDVGGLNGPAEQYIDSVTKSLLPMTVESHLIYGRRDGALPDGLSSHRSIAPLGDPGAWDDDAAAELAAALREIDPHVVYVHRVHDCDIIRQLDANDRRYVLLWYVHDHSLTCLTGLRAWEGVRKPVCDQALSEDCLWHARTGRCRAQQEDPGYDAADLTQRLQLLQAARRVDALVVVSEFMRDSIARNLPDVGGRIHVLPRQLPYSLAGRQAPGNGDPVTVVFSGEIRHEQGLHVAIEALARTQSDENIAFKIAGAVRDSGYWWKCLQAAREAELHNPFLEIHHLGRLGRQDLGNLYSDADLVVVPSLWADPLCDVATEALRHGAAVLASDAGGMRCCIEHGETGLLVAPNDHQGLSDAFELLVSNPDYRRRLGEAGRQLVSRRFSVRQHLQALSALIMDCQALRRAWA
ncbi:MAG: glycosyltransferase family 4 protein [Gammaproteobacteria bacterium]